MVVVIATLVRVYSHGHVLADHMHATYQQVDNNAVVLAAIATMLQRRRDVNFVHRQLRLHKAVQWGFVRVLCVLTYMRVHISLLRR